MSRCCTLLAATWFCLCAPAVYGQDPPAPPPQPADIVRTIQITGTRELSDEEIRRAMRVAAGQPLPDTPDRLANAIVRRYEGDGYTFAQATVAFDAATGALSVTVDEGVIDAVEFQGVGARLARTLGEEFALRAGDVFNGARARQALDVLLRPTRGAVRPGRVYFRDTRDLGSRRGTFDLIDRDGHRVLLVGLREPRGRFKLVPDLGDREDWFTPVDGFVPSLGFGAAVFDHARFNHAYVSGHLSIRTATSRVGYALGFERPLFGDRKLYLGGELHDLTATDDAWQVSSAEASLAAFGPRKSFRDYYRRRGVQINAAFRVHPRAELLMAWRGERQEQLTAETDFSIWNDDEPFRPNLAARNGRLRAIVIGASVDGDGFDRESLESSYRRHQLETPFGARLNTPEGNRDRASMWRVDWTSEISTPGTLGSDFDFRRHIVTGRARLQLSPHQDFGVRAIGGWSDGALPPQRQFAIGGIGSVHGYEFKEQIGDRLALVNLEYSLGWRNNFEVVGFFDAGRADSGRVIPLAQTVAPSAWLKGVGFGIGAGGARLDFGYKLDAIPSSLQVLLRLGRTF
jgi:outer membrane protein assembly factor BamA